MNISHLKFLKINSQTSNNQGNFIQKYSIPNDSVSFSAMKKSAFSGMDLAMVNLLKSPIEKFNSKKDFYDYENKQLQELFKTEYEGRDAKITCARADYLAPWKTALSQKPYSDNPPLSLFIYSSITKKLTKNSDTLPPLFTPEVLTKTVDDMSEKLINNPKSGYDFVKKYNENAFNFFDIPNEGWVSVPSTMHDIENSIINLSKLKLLSTNTWCTKSEKSVDYITDSDFYIYVKDSKPHICIKVTSGAIAEIQGFKNNNIIPFEYLDMVESFVKENSLYDELSLVDKSKRIRSEQAKFMAEIGAAITNKDYPQILKYFGIKSTENEKGEIELSEYHQPSRNITFDSLGIDENDMFKNVVKINGKAIFSNSALTSLQSLKEIGGYADFSKSQFKDTGNLENIGGNAVFSNSNIERLLHIKKLSGGADFSRSKVKSLGELEEIGGETFFTNAPIEDFGKLKSIDGDVVLGLTNSDAIKGIKIYGKIR